MLNLGNVSVVKKNLDSSVIKFFICMTRSDLCRCVDFGGRLISKSLNLGNIAENEQQVMVQNVTQDRSEIVLVNYNYMHGIIPYDQWWLQHLVSGCCFRNYHRSS